MIQVLVEVLHNIQTCNLYITLPVGAGICQNMVNGKVECILHFENEKEILLKLPKGTYLVPNSVTNMTQEAGIITARLQTDEKASLISALSDNILGNADMYHTDAQPSKTMSDAVVLAQCKLCQNCVYENVKFRRVLPLPSVDWDQASEGWFCHLHANDGQKLKPASLQPEHDECFYTELFFLLHKIKLECMSVECDGYNINCSECNVSLGMKTAQSLKLWTHTLVWVEEHGNIIYNRNVNEIILSLFQNIDRDNFGVNCRLVLEALTVPKKYLYMVTMSTNQKIFLSDSLQNVLDGTESSMPNGRKEESESEGPQSKRMCVENREEVSLKKIYAVKVLYLLKEGEDSQTGAWVDDINVHIVPCSGSFLQAVHAMLQNFTCVLPNSVRTVEDMHLGYIIQ